MTLRLAPALALLLAPLAVAEDTAPAPAPPTTTTTTTTTTSFPASAPVREERGPSVEVGTPDTRLRVLDIRLTLGAQHGPTRIHDDYRAGAGSMNPTGGVDYGVKRDQNGGGIFQASFVMGRLHDWGGLVWGAGLRGAGHTIDLVGGSAIPQTQDLSYSTFGLIGHVDYGFAFTRNWHVEVGPFLSLGGASMDWFDQDATTAYREETASGSYVQGGLRAGTYVALWRHVVLGFDLEYSSTYARMDAEHSASGGKSELTVREHGFGGLVTVGYRF
jgi:hypothetical protein